MEGRGLTKVATVCRPKFVRSLSPSSGNHFIRPKAKNQLMQRKETLSSAYTFTRTCIVGKTSEKRRLALITTMTTDFF